MTPLDDPAYLWCRKIYPRFTSDRWVCDPRNLYSNPLLAELHEIEDQPVREYSDRKIRTLLSYGFVTARDLDNGQVEFTKAAECPKPPEADSRDWVTKENARIQQRVQWEQAETQRAAEQTKAHDRFLNGPPLAEQVAELVTKLVTEQVGQVDTRLAALEAAVERIEAALVAGNTNALNGAQEVVS